MSLPKPLSSQTLQRLSKDPHVYETAKQTIDAHNQLLASLNPELEGMKAEIASLSARVAALEND